MDELNLWMPSEQEVARMTRSESRLKDEPSRRDKRQKSRSERRWRVHQALIERYPPPWTLENLGIVNYTIVAINGGFFDPRRSRRRPRLVPMSDPESTRRMANVDIVSTIKQQELLRQKAKAKEAFEKQQATSGGVVQSRIGNKR